MKKNTIGLFLGSLILSLGVMTFALVPNKHADITFATYDNGDGATYYNSIDDSQSGNTLLTSLRSLNLSKRKSTVGYSSMGTTPSGQYKYTDYDPNYVKYDSNGQPYGTQILSFYTFTSATSWNREHVWPNSHGGGNKGDAGSPYPDADIHMPRPTISSENSSRGNSFFVEGMNHSSNGWDPKTAGYSEDSRGEAARITFYCTLVNSKLILAPNNTTPSGTDSVTGQSFGSGHTMGNLETLLRWNVNHPVNDREKRRNEGAEYLQGNRNPFIDHPEYACKIWGNVNSTTKSICQNAVYPTGGHTVGIRVDDGYETATTNTTAYTLKVGDTVNFLPFVDGAFNASVSWSLTDYSVTSSTYYSRGSYTNGVTIEGLTEGVSTLTLSYTYDDNGTPKTAKATTLITVTTSGGGSGGEGGGDATDVDNIKTATYTVSSNSAVSTTGTAPSGSSAKYSQTFNTKGQITSGKNAILTLSGYSGKVITGITLNMKSNGSSGAGTFSAVSGSTSLANTSGSFNTWYNNDSFGTSWRDVVVNLTNDTHITGTSEDIVLTITGTTNSLYINSYQITYGDPSSGGDTPVEVVLESISASGMTQSYQVGDTFSFDGILKANYSDGNSETVIPDSVTSPDMSTAGNKTITLSYTDGGVTKTTSYTIYVVAKQLVLSSITLSGQKTSYYVGDTFSFTGTCTAHYEDSSVTKSVTPTVSTPDMSSAGDKTITVSYTENGVTKETSYTINVQTIVVESISLGGLTTEYYIGDELVKPTVTAHYNTGATANVTSEAVFSGFNSSTVAASQTITVSFGGKQAQYTVSISERPIDPTPASGDFEKVTSLSEITDESEVIIVSTKSSTNYAFDARDAQNGYTAVTITSDKIAYTEDTAKLACNIKPVSGGYTIQVGSANTSNPGKYISGTSGSNKLNFDTSASTLTIAAATNTGRKDGGTWDVTSNTSVLSFNANSGNYRYRFYKSTTYTDSNYYAVDFYMRTSSGGSTEKTLTSITLSNTTTAYTQGADFVKPTVTAHYDDSSSAVVTTASFSGYDMFTTGTYLVTAYYTEGGVTKSASYQITVSENAQETTPLADFHNGTITLKEKRDEAEWFYIKGIVVGINGYQYYIQEGDYGILVYNEVQSATEWLPTYYEGIALGDYVLLHARVYSYYGLVETSSRDLTQTVTKLGNRALPDAVDYSSVSSFMNAHQSIRASLSNLAVDETNINIIKAATGTETEDIAFTAYDVNNPSDTVKIFIHKSIRNREVIVNKLKTITVYDTLEFLRCVVAYHKGKTDPVGYNQISLGSADQVVVHTPSEDKLAAWGVNYLFMNDESFIGNGTGQCKSSNLYKDAKTQLFILEASESGIITTLQEDSTYEAELARYLAWAKACGDASPFIEDYSFMNSAVDSIMNINGDNMMIVVIAIATISALSFGTLLLFKKKRK